ncbi:MAG TPA: isoprenylcysteine carboxylmethyltransferase family protein [Candidatus Dormibacteraeota bacterium]|nr:isoprenylcysteine carboxylmethyltransferase family protein [Candidatus Dormibacteraeota bacterium]
MQLLLLRTELSTAWSNLPDLGASAFILNRLLSLAFVAGVALIYIVRRPPTIGRHDPVAFLVSMYASFVLLAYRPVAELLHFQPELNHSPTALMLSNLLVVAGVGLSVCSLLYLRFNFSIMPEARQLITRGPYRIVRHPIYLGEILSGGGLVLALPHPFFLVLLVTFIAAQLFRTRIEEAILRKAFPDYDGFARRTRYRLIPGVV